MIPSPPSVSASANETDNNAYLCQEQRPNNVPLANQAQVSGGNRQLNLAPGEVDDAGRWARPSPHPNEIPVPGPGDGGNLASGSEIILVLGVV